MNWNALFTMQRNLDAFITDNHNLHGKDLFEERFLALLVELGELANETRCFKFWSTKASSERSIVLEEYVDNIHFLLSIGLHKGYEFEHIEVEQSTAPLTESFNAVFNHAVQFYTDRSQQNYKVMFRAYLQLAYLLGFTEDDIFKAYHEKNEVNYERQEQGY
ncbi:MAG TPA: dUTP diphosphatase [Pseudogracilibacillus sp.]|nr:dUTP diphosphatase [Pseudogracilibacillus sp.]